MVTATTEADADAGLYSLEANLRRIVFEELGKFDLLDVADLVKEELLSGESREIIREEALEAATELVEELREDLRRI